MADQKKNIVFIVDDDPDDRQLVLDALLENKPDIDCLFIEGGKELIDTLKNTEPDNYPSLVLLDLNMPGMLGLVALKEIRENKDYAQIPIVILTTSTFWQDESSAYKLGANCFLHKPQSYRELVDITKSLLKLWMNGKS